MTPAAPSVVVPFAVPPRARGLGLGLAALLHGFLPVRGRHIALAQMFSRGTDDARPEPLEAFLPPPSWRELVEAGHAPEDVGLVLTGVFEPPLDGQPGHLALLAFRPGAPPSREPGGDARPSAGDVAIVAKLEGHLDDVHTADALLEMLKELAAKCEGELGPLQDAKGLGWGALESVLRAERCALFDPSRGGAHDRMAALVHLGRAVADAPDSLFPAGRLAAFALDVALGPQRTMTLTAAAERALDGAIDDAPDRIELVEARSALALRTGDPERAERLARAALARDDKRPRLWALVSEARRADGDPRGALATLELARAALPASPLLDTEAGIAFAEAGETALAREMLSRVLAKEPLYPPAYLQMAQMFEGGKGGIEASKLVDAALAAAEVHPDVLRAACEMVLAHEVEGTARSARLAKLAESLSVVAPDDARPLLLRARALADLGEKDEAAACLRRVEQLAPGTIAAAEAQSTRLAVSHPAGALEVDAVLRAAYKAQVPDLEAVVLRARTLAERYQVWSAFAAAGVAERRLGRYGDARSSFTAALAAAPGSVEARLELSSVELELGATAAALEHAEAAVRLEADTPRVLAALASALFASGRRDEAAVTIDRALAQAGSDPGYRALAERIHSLPPPRQRSALGRVADLFSRFRK